MATIDIFYTKCIFSFSKGEYKRYFGWVDSIEVREEKTVRVIHDENGMKPITIPYSIFLEHLKRVPNQVITQAVKRGKYTKRYLISMNTKGRGECVRTYRDR